MPRTTGGWIPKENRDTLTCKECGEAKPPSMFLTKGVTKSGHKAYHSRCKPCYHKHTSQLPSTKLRGSREYRKQVIQKREFVAARRLKCQACGYNNCFQALDFHHVDPAEKEFTVSAAVIDRTVSAEQLVAEMEKCVVLCSNSHREHHAGLEVIF